MRLCRKVQNSGNAASNPYGSTPGATTSFESKGRTEMRTTLWLCFAYQCTVAWPSFRLRLPNGERVPCPSDVPGCDADTDFCKGVGHTSCAGCAHKNTCKLQYARVSRAFSMSGSFRRGMHLESTSKRPVLSGPRDSAKWTPTETVCQTA